MMGVLRSQRLGLILLLGALAAACGEDARPEGGDNYERNKKLRKAICTALDWEERNDSFYNSKNVIYDGMIPPGLDGHPKNHKVEGMGYGGANIELAKKLLAEAGYPGGQGLPAIEYYTSKAGNSKEQAELLKRQLAEIGVKVNVRLVDFSTLIETINTKKAPFFAFAWSSDYPDAENNLALFYGPNESPGSNHFNYKNAEFDRLYEKVRSMKPGPERTALYEKMRDIVIEEAPFAGAMARTRHYVVQPALKNFKPVEDFYNWVKYLDVDKATSDGKKVLSLPMRTDGPKSLDPVQGSTVYDNRACTQVYQTLVQYKYLRRPLALEPLLLAEMPQISEDGLTYRFKLKSGIKFQDNACFPEGKGRELVSSDVIYSWKRLANNQNDPKSWWLLDGQIVGFDAYRDEQNAAVEGGGKFDYDKKVEGLKILSDTEFEVTLTEPVYAFMWKLAMFQLAVVPREAVEHYGDQFVRNPVGTGPFMLDSWEPRVNMAFVRNPNYWNETYPTEHMPEDAEMGFAKAAGKRLPLVDRVEITMFQEDQTMWLEFETGNILYTQVPAENFPQAFNKRTRELKPEYVERGIKAHAVPLLDFIFFGFNMEDPLLGGNSVAPGTSN